ncbi:MAG: PH domain-containing protein, partial [Candidatus Promineifilaceae bacterium]
MAMGETMSWTFHSKTKIPSDVEKILIAGEKAILAYKTFRDVAVVTNKRFIIADREGLRGKKIETYTIPFKSIIMYSTENAHGFMDFNSEVELWTRAGKFKLRL